ncbi:hypothetical protein [Brevifollis gellanilyticus]|uniref:Uncharacterized protein n=1 Tax=Brevifollis gellanilyticus TaxID=748831 RepID=A0A512MHF6_9BACT|nr:hypothetical protein [Brevifollis gellanilyticus]GEP46178.1 hypothetical protein BGE01nite_54690 [Brevifollis gellanilyticus]
MKALLLLSVLISLASPALARIGETREQCEARYGKPVRVDEKDQRTHHEKAGFQVECHFHEDKCDHLKISHADKDASGEPLPLSDSELTTLLEASSNGKAWEIVVKDDAAGSVFWTSGEVLQAFYSTRPRCVLRIETQGYLDRIKPAQAAPKTGTIKDF